MRVRDDGVCMEGPGEAVWVGDSACMHEMINVAYSASSVHVLTIIVFAVLVRFLLRGGNTHHIMHVHWAQQTDLTVSATASLWALTTHASIHACMLLLCDSYVAQPYPSQPPVYRSRDSTLMWGRLEVAWHPPLG